MNKLVLGHRGYKELYPENTLLAFRKAFEAGANGVEYDVRESSDGIPVIIHDDSLERLTGHKIMISESTVPDIKKHLIDGKEEVPTLEEALKIFPENSFNNLEVKELNVAVKSYEYVKKYGSTENTLFSSFIPESLEEIRKCDENAKLGLLMGSDDLEAVMKLHSAIGLYSVNIWIDKLKEYDINLVKAIAANWKSKGIKIAFWTFDDENDIPLYGDFADILITNRVEAIIKKLYK